VPRLVVIDEAHNVCPQVPVDPIQAIGTEHVIRIAAEGRKYGLYLLLSTQQPQKIHANVLAQCDNLILLRMNSTVDIDHLTKVFGFVPPSLLHQAAAFRLGEGLVAGNITSHALRYQGARRWTREGGADVPATWASPG
jgi:DNA helicase HerA-like ATPase